MFYRLRFYITTTLNFSSSHHLARRRAVSFSSSYLRSCCTSCIPTPRRGTWPYTWFGPWWSLWVGVVFPQPYILFALTLPNFMGCCETKHTVLLRWIVVLWLRPHSWLKLCIFPLCVDEVPTCLLSPCRSVLHVLPHDPEFHGSDAGRAIDPVGVGPGLCPLVPTATLPLLCEGQVGRHGEVYPCVYLSSGVAAAPRHSAGSRLLLSFSSLNTHRRTPHSVN